MRVLFVVALVLVFTPLALADAPQLRVVEPGAAISAGEPWSLYVELTRADGTPISGAGLHLVVDHDGYETDVVDAVTTSAGRAYFRLPSTEDSTFANWTLNATFNDDGTSYALVANGTVRFERRLASINATLADQQLHGVHLDELGTHNLLLEIGRVTLYASVIAGVVLLTVLVSFRV